MEFYKSIALLVLHKKCTGFWMVVILHASDKNRRRTENNSLIVSWLSCTITIIKAIYGGKMEKKTDFGFKGKYLTFWDKWKITCKQGNVYKTYWQIHTTKLFTVKRISFLSSKYLLLGNCLFGNIYKSGWHIQHIKCILSDGNSRTSKQKSGTV